jgi:hypothetical protein
MRRLCGRLEFLWVFDSQANQTDPLDLANAGFQNPPSLSATIIENHLAGHKDSPGVVREDEEVVVSIRLASNQAWCDC